MMRDIRVLIIDDEPLARRGIRQLVDDDPQIEVLGEYGSGLDALESINQTKPDLIFLDVQMPRMNGFELLSLIPRENLPSTIFVTAHDKYAIAAFEAEALDYLLKPFTEDRFYKALERAKNQLKLRLLEDHRFQLSSLLRRRRQEEQQSNQPEYTRKLLIKSGGNLNFLPVNEIDWIEAADYYALLHVGVRTFSLRETLSELEARLDPNQFIRIHRSSVVNIERIRRLQAQRTGEILVVLADGAQLKMSRRRRVKFHDLLARFS